jgi:hypothetical protein
MRKDVNSDWEQSSNILACSIMVTASGMRNPTEISRRESLAEFDIDTSMLLFNQRIIQCLQRGGKVTFAIRPFRRR